MSNELKGTYFVRSFGRQQIWQLQHISTVQVQCDRDFTDTYEYILKHIVVVS